MSMSLRWRISLQCLTTMEHGGEGEGGKLTNSIAEGTRSVGRSVYLREDQEREGPDSASLSLSLLGRADAVHHAGELSPRCLSSLRRWRSERQSGRARAGGGVVCFFFVGGGSAEIASREVQTRDAFIDSRILILRARTWQRGQCGQRSPLRNFILTIAGQ